MDHLPPLRDPELVLRTIAETLARASWLPRGRGESTPGAEGTVRSDNWVGGFDLRRSHGRLTMPWAVSTPTTSSAAPASSAAPGASPSSAHELPIATTGASSTHGTTWPDG